jgi:hypothetical protein
LILICHLVPKRNSCFLFLMSCEQILSFLVCKAGRRESSLAFIEKHPISPHGFCFKKKLICSCDEGLSGETCSPPVSGNTETCGDPFFFALAFPCGFSKGGSQAFGREDRFRQMGPRQDHSEFLSSVSTGYVDAAKRFP